MAVFGFRYFNRCFACFGYNWGDLILDKFIYSLVSSMLMFFAIGWAIFTIFSSFGTACFNVLYSYITIFVFILELVWNNLIKYSKEE